MRILYIVSELDKCGASLSFLTLLRGMREKGIEAFVVSPDWNLVDDNFVALLQKMSVPYKLLPITWDIKDENPKSKTIKRKIKDLIKWFLRRGNNPKKNKEEAITQLQEIINNFNPDIVHTNVGVIHIGYEICKKMGIKHVWHIREYQDLDFHWVPLPSKDAFINQLKDTDAVITITKDLKKYFGLDNCNTARTIYNGVFNQSESSLELPKSNYFLCASRLVQAKGHVDVVKAFGSFYKDNPHYQLIFAGIGDNWYIDQLKLLANELHCEEGVSFIGHQKEMKPYMKKAKALIVASYSEGFGRMTAEAAFCGCLVIGRNTAGTKEILDEIGGFRFEKSSEELFEQMRIVSQLTDEEYLRLAQYAQNRAKELYSNENYVSQVYDVYKQLYEKEKE